VELQPPFVQPPDPRPLCPPQIPHGLTRTYTDAKAGLRGEKPATNRPELLHDLSRISQHLSGESELKKGRTNRLVSGPRLKPGIPSTNDCLHRDVRGDNNIGL
jgi:hypothetical protein